MITRRTFLRGLVALAAGGFGLGGYAVAEPFRLGVTRYQVMPPNWPAGLSIKLAVIADVHVCEPFMGLARLAHIVETTNALGADAILLLGDYAPSHRMKRISRIVPGGRVVGNDETAAVLAGLQAPRGVYAVLGNHDWWDDRAVQFDRTKPVPMAEALKRQGIAMFENDAVRLEKNGQAFWVAGLGDQWAYWPKTREQKRKRIPYVGVDDLPKTLGAVSDDAPVILMAHEPDIFAHMGDLGSRVALTVSGHTHGGQVSLLGWTPVVPSAYGSRFVYGHIVEQNRHLIVSGGLGCSGLPVRFGSPPEIVLIEVGSGVA